jgi:hypothetical protein
MNGRRPGQVLAGLRPGPVHPILKLVVQRVALGLLLLLAVSA